jgi:hypothetical protein
MSIANYNSQVIRDGYRNYVIRLTGAAVVGTDTDQLPTVLVTVANLNPPCSVLRIDRVKYSMPHGSPFDVQLYWQATTNELAWGTSGGDTDDFWNVGGIVNNLPAGFTGNLMWGTSGLTSGTQGTSTTSALNTIVAGTVLTFAIIVECVKLQVKYPL